MEGIPFLWNMGRRSGYSPRTDDLAIHFSDKCHIAADDLIIDMRRFRTPLDSLSGFLATIQVVLYGPGFIKTMSVKDAVLAVVETFLCANRIPAQISAWAILERPPSDWSGAGEQGNSDVARGLFYSFFTLTDVLLTLPFDTIPDRFGDSSTIPSWIVGDRLSVIELE